MGAVPPLTIAHARLAQLDSATDDAADMFSAESIPLASAARPSGVIRRTISALRDGSARKPARLSTPPRRPLDKLVALQRANGSWEPTPDLASRLGVPIDLLHVRPTGLDDAAWATLLTLAWLEKHAGDERDEWMRLARKAETWLTQTVPPAALSAARAAAQGAIG
jgi:hypothetical protein